MIDCMDLKLEFVTTRQNKSGVVRYYFRRKGHIERLPDDPRTPEFMTAYLRCMERRVAIVAADEGSFAWLCDEYMGNPAFTNLGNSTQNARRRILIEICKEPIDPDYPELMGQERVSRFTPNHIRALRDRKAAKPFAANERLKILNQIFKLAVARGWTESNPVRDVERVRTPRGGHETATSEQLAQYLAKHTTGAPLLAMELLMFAGMRVSDLRRVGRMNVKNSCLEFVTQKTGVRCILPLPMDLERKLSSLPVSLPFLVTDHGKAFASDKAISARVAKWMRQAGIVGVTAHGVRKWAATQMAEKGATEFELMAWFGWRDPKEAKPYTSAASRKDLAKNASLKRGEV